VQKLGACLLDAKEEEDDPVSVKMNKWAAEATSLMVCMALRNPWAVRAFNTAVDASSSPGKTCAGQWKSSHLLVTSRPYFLPSTLLSCNNDCKSQYVIATCDCYM